MRSSAIRSAFKEISKQQLWLFQKDVETFLLRAHKAVNHEGATSCLFIPCLRRKKETLWKILRILCQSFLLEMKGFFMNVALGLKIAFSALNLRQNCFRRNQQWILSCIMGWHGLPPCHSCKLETLLFFFPWGKGQSLNEVAMLVDLYRCSTRMRKASLCTFSRGAFLILMLSQRAQILTHECVQAAPATKST